MLLVSSHFAWPAFSARNAFIDVIWLILNKNQKHEICDDFGDKVSVCHSKQGAESDMLCLVVRLLAQHRFQQTRLIVMLGSLDGFFSVLN